MALFFVVLAINIVNLAFGYMLAVYWGFGPPTLADAWRALFAARSTGTASDAISEPSGLPQPESPTEAPPDASLPAAAEEPSDLIPESEVIPLETFRQFMAISTSSLADFARRLEKCNREYHATTGWTFVAELQEICQPYLEKLGRVMEHPSNEIGDDVQELVLGQIAQLETTLSNLRFMDFDAGAAAAIERLSQETAKTLASSRALQNAIQAAPRASGQDTSAELPQPAETEFAVSA